MRGSKRKGKHAPTEAEARGRLADIAGMAALAGAVAGLFFCLSYAALGEPVFAVILTLLAMLPAAGLATSSASGQMRR